MKSKENLSEERMNLLKFRVARELCIPESEVSVRVVYSAIVEDDHSLFQVEIPLRYLLYPEIFDPFEGFVCLMIDALVSAGVYSITYSCK